MERLESFLKEPEEIRVARALPDRIWRHQAPDNLDRLLRKIANDTGLRERRDIFDPVINKLIEQGYLIQKEMPTCVLIPYEAKQFYLKTYLDLQ